MGRVHSVEGILPPASGTLSGSVLPGVFCDVHHAGAVRLVCSATGAAMGLFFGFRFAFTHGPADAMEK
jgi:hypothetical protein